MKNYPEMKKNVILSAKQILKMKEYLKDRMIKVFCRDVLELVDPSYIVHEVDVHETKIGIGMRMCAVCRQPLRDPVLDRSIDCACTPKLARKRSSIYTGIAE